jgi:hypothetical protein
MIGFVSKNVYIFQAFLLFRAFFPPLFRNLCVNDRLRQQECIYFPGVIAFLRCYMFLSSLVEMVEALLATIAHFKQLLMATPFAPRHSFGRAAFE